MIGVTGAADLNGGALVVPAARPSLPRAMRQSFEADYLLRPSGLTRRDQCIDRSDTFNSRGTSHEAFSHQVPPEKRNGGGLASRHRRIHRRFARRRHPEGQHLLPLHENQE
jgi:hypothetical protein